MYADQEASRPLVAGLKRWDERPRRAPRTSSDSYEEVAMPVLTPKKTDCPVCKRPIAGHHTTIEVHGLKFHAYCAGYKRRAEAA
jgi:hypothetical protein